MYLDSIRVLAPAKVNLSLDITGKREDGYHFMKMVMQAIDLYDTVTIEKQNMPGISVEVDAPHVPCDHTNIVVKAAHLFLESMQIKDAGLKIEIEKEIPVAAGMGGGSANAAAVLVGLNAMYRANLSVKKLCDLGQQVGADVPFCIIGGTALVEGIGEIITPLPHLQDIFMVVVKPAQGVSTKQAFEKFDKVGSDAYPDTEKLVAAIVANDIEVMGQEMRNVLEEVCTLPQVKHIRSIMLENGALGSVMTGSGSAVFGVFESKRKASKCAGVLEEQYGKVFVCQPVAHGAEISEK